MKALLFIILIIATIGVFPQEKRYNFTEIHKIHYRSVFSWGRDHTKTDTLMHFDAPILLDEKNYIDSLGLMHSIRITNIKVIYVYPIKTSNQILAQ